MTLVRVNIDEYWEDIKEGLNTIQKETHEAETPEDVYVACINNEAILWIDKDIEPKDGFLITQVLKRNFSNERYLLLWIAWYREQSGADKFQASIEDLARLLGCQSIEFWTSKKEIRDHGINYGYDKITYKCVKEI